MVDAVTSAFASLDGLVYVGAYVEAVMVQVTLDMNDETVRVMRAAADAAGVSMSAWVSGLVREGTRGEWPPEVVASFGTWGDFPTADELRASEGVDVARETL